jgi:hypothetical protein
MRSNILGTTHYRESDDDGNENILYEHIFPDQHHKLAMIHHWRRNRPPDMTRIREIADDISTRGMCDGELCIAIHPSLGCICYDGSHRLEAARICFPRFGLRIRVWFTNEEAEIEREFIRINRGVPVPELYFSREETDIFLRTILERFIGEKLLCDSRIKEHVSTSRNPKRPNFNKDVLMEQLGTYIREFYTSTNNLTSSDIHRTITPETLMDWFNDMNEYARNDVESSIKDPTNINTMIEKCRKTGWFLFYCNWQLNIAPILKLYTP